MRVLLFILGVVFLGCWVLGFILYHTTGALIHFLIFFAILSFILSGLSRGKN